VTGPQPSDPAGATAHANHADHANHSTTEQDENDIRQVSVGQLIGDVSRDLSTLMRQEVELAKAEIKTEVAKAGKGAGMLGGAGFAGYMLVLFLSALAALMISALIIYTVLAKNSP